MKRKFYILLFASFTACLFLSTIQAQDLPPCWESTDIGDVAATGDAFLEDDTLIVMGGGADIWDVADAFHFAYLPSDGDCEISAYIASTTLTDNSAKACVMIRETLEADSKYAMSVACPVQGTYFQRRLETAGESSNDNLEHGYPSPVWVKLKRAGNTFTSYYSKDGETWLPDGGISLDIEMEYYDVYVGLGVSAHNNDGSICETKFSNVVVESEFECETAIKDLSSDLLSVYPNPVTDILTLDIGKNPHGTNSMIYIHNTLGQLVLKEKITGNSHSIDLSDVPTGLYYVTLSTDHEEIVKKVVKK